MGKASVSIRNGFRSVGRYFAHYFRTFGIRQIATIIMLAASVVALVGVCIPHELTILIGLYLYAAASLGGIIDAILIMTRNPKRAPAFKRAVVGLAVMIIIFAIALTGILVSHLIGIYQL